MNENLKSLLMSSQGNEFVSRLREHLDFDDKFEYVETGSLPQHHVFRIYSARAKLWKRRSARVEGVDELLTSLEETAEPIVVHRFNFPQESFLLFTDTAESKIVGILLAQKTENTLKQRR